MSYLIYLVEDEENLNQVLASYLEKEGWQVRCFSDGNAARAAIMEAPHLWILDIMLPHVDGYQLIREIKARQPHTPVIFISARDAELDRVIGLEMGSDDYLPKPFLPRELVIRAGKLLQRIYAATSSPAANQTAAALGRSVRMLPPYEIDEGSRMARIDGQKIELTTKEFDLLLLLSAHPGQALSREQILLRIWGEEYDGSDRVVDDLMRRLRKKLPKLRVESIYGYGYRLVER
ncbi:DNA-binding response regulator [Brevibacillus borstelensis]|uniref:response regulator transcription factor n=1 Tax=Brevibacillus borstelensis TaxID=45462 RepID=UPI000F0763EF|nr:response regulator transcription factor [Brevibacillus borstelensis]MED1883592.1 response regulator transcription factor [Brevibacillus borstelensis]RNB61829.1 DNA-binding response regulator [Brevibacillus borstelensis]GED51516.1 transcriptional regulatory protein CssR [Brevibacillus borstelensis]